MPKTRPEYCILKVEDNAERDHISKSELEAAGLNVITVWECELKKSVIEKTLNKLVFQLNPGVL